MTRTLLVGLVTVVLAVPSAARADAKEDAAANCRRGEDDKAVADATEAIRFDPSDAERYIVRAYAYLHRREYAKAIADCNEALRLGAPGGGVVFMLDYDAGIRFAPQNGVAYIVRASVREHQGDYIGAEADCDKAIRLDPHSSNAYDLRGAVHLSEGEYEKAIADCTAAIRLNPNKAQAYFRRADAYVNTQEYDKAITDCTEALRLDPNSWAAYKTRAAAYRALGAMDDERKLGELKK